MGYTDKMNNDEKDMYIKAFQKTVKILEKDLDILKKENEKLKEYISKIDAALMVPAAEYVPAIGEVFSIIDKVKEMNNSKNNEVY